MEIICLPLVQTLALAPIPHLEPLSAKQAFKVQEVFV